MKTFARCQYSECQQESVRVFPSYQKRGRGLFCRRECFFGWMKQQLHGTARLHGKEARIDAARALGSSTVKRSTRRSKMKRKIALALMLLVGSPVKVMAAVDYTADGRVAQSGVYEGPGFDTTDAALSAAPVAAYVAHAMTYSSPAVMIAAPAGVFVLGARRVQLHRPQEVKDRIHANLEQRRKMPRAGSFESTR